LSKFLAKIFSRLLFYSIHTKLLYELAIPNLSGWLDFFCALVDTVVFCQKFLKYKNLSPKRQNILDNSYPFNYNLTKKLKDKFALQVANCA